MGGHITVTATDDTAVMGLHVCIEQMDGTLVEEGEAVQVGHSPAWVASRTATAANPTAACKVTVPQGCFAMTATDKPGHTGVKMAAK